MMKYRPLPLVVTILIPAISTMAQDVVPDVVINDSQVAAQTEDGNVHPDWNHREKNVAIGYEAAGAGELQVPAGARVEVFNAFLGLGDQTASGRLEITGQDAFFGTYTPSGDATSQLHVGVDGTGEVLVTDGGYLYTQPTRLGINPGSHGTITLDGPDALWRARNWSIAVGDQGTGVLTVTNGAVMENYHTLNVGVNSVLDDQDNVIGGGIGYVNVLNGATVSRTGSTNTNVSIAAQLGTQGFVLVSGEDSHMAASNITYVGTRGEGHLTVESGASYLSEGSVRVGSIGEDAVGFLTVTDPGTTMQVNSFVDIGREGTGTFQLENQAAFSLTGAVRLGREATAHGDMAIRGNATLDIGQWLYIGEFGTGTMLVEGGSTIETHGGSFQLGMDAAAEGSAVIRGPGSSVTASSYIYVGDSGYGHLVIEDGARVESGTSFSIQASNTPGIVSHLHVTGEGSLAKSGSFFRVGRVGEGSMLVDDGGRVEVGAGDFTIGSGSSSVGTVTVTGAQSSLVADENTRVGASGVGTYNILAGAYAETGTELQIAGGSSAEGTALVDGIGSTLRVMGPLLAGAELAAPVAGPDSGESDPLAVATGGVAYLTISNGGHVQADDLFAMRGAGALHMAGGTLDIAGVLDVADPASTLGFNLTATGFQGITAAGALFDGTNLTIGLGFQPEIDDLFVLIDVAGTGLISGELAYDGTLLGEGDTFLVTDGAFEQLFSVTYGQDGNNLAITAIPEPSAWALLLGVGAIGLVVLRRRRLV